MSTCVSASGKVLLAGGYLVLDPEYSGVVVSTSSRFYSIVSNASFPGDRPKITVRSPQFKNAVWDYFVDIASQPLISAEGQSSRNKFVETALEGVFKLAQEIRGSTALHGLIKGGLEIIILGDNDFYSQRERLQSLNLPSTSAGLNQIPRFCTSSTTLGDVHKTGLGSSAALISSLVTALLVHLGVPPREQIREGGLLTSSALALAHNTAQYVHCLAQGKIGSGFDVSAAIYGSHLYTRFDPKVLEPLVSKDPASDVSLSTVLSSLNTGWNHHVTPFNLPPNLRIILADVDAGSDTPSLVGKVLKWRGSVPSEAKKLWDDIAKSNSRFASLMEELNREAKTESMYIPQLQQCARTKASEWRNDATNVEGLLYKTWQTAQEIRAGMKTMGQAADVPIEPNEQTSLIDACLEVPGVVCGGVPGAGGYDAIWLLLIDTESEGTSSPIVTAVEEIWGGWTEMNVSPLGASESRSGGARVEHAETVPGLMEALRRGW